jgi:thiamine-monophosphate kinase
MEREAHRVREPEMRRAAEFDLIRAVRERLGPPAGERHFVGIGDDAAVSVPGGATATTIDAFVDGVHFRSAWCPPADRGHKAMAAALSDLAAMGAEAGEAFAWMGIPPELSEPECLEICDGLAAVARRHGAVILGGDVTRSPVLALAVTAVGHAASPDELVGRGGAAEGDAICLTGPVGGAAAGLALLEEPALAAGLEPAVSEPPIAAQLHPEPRLAAGRALAAAGARAMIDVSDGLGADAEHLAAASGVGIEIELEAVPLVPGVAEVAAAAGRDAFELACDGEDYELLCAVPRPRLAAAGQAVAGSGSELVEVGRVVAAPGVRLRLPGGGYLPVRGHDHLGR